MEKKVVTDETDLFCELNGIAGTLTAISNQCGDNTEHLTEEALQNVLYSLSQHIKRISEDWMLLSEMQTGRIKELLTSQSGKGDVEHV